MATLFENCSDEIFMLIFEYLDVCRLHNSFRNINTRLNKILDDKRLQLMFDSRGTQFINPFVRDQIVSMILDDNGKATFVNENFISIQSVTLYVKDYTTEFISKLKSLTTITQLIIHTAEHHANNIIEMILCQNMLPQLKILIVTESCLIRNKISSTAAINNLVYLIITCTWHDLSAILEHSPKLKYVNISLLGGNRLTKFIFPTIKYLTVNISSTYYNELFHMLKTMPNLKMFELTGHSCDDALSDGEKLRELILSSSSRFKLNIQLFVNLFIKNVLSTFRDEYWCNIQCKLCMGFIKLSAISK
ncbi:unnamed protein product [Didymodactylos carnosus]|uniref:F-box domain-containing protein n=1 Tax=Didymodactylos carnosus TaxID=1234261 RepID=A0A8S2E6J8_9BILA|nr:unnamed protein product [Didymodactylos carnosus]CAF3845335.1 unnamed protein product [Didymodactylos carnosus]